MQTTVNPAACTDTVYSDSDKTSERAARSPAQGLHRSGNAACCALSQPVGSDLQKLPGLPATAAGSPEPLWAMLTSRSSPRDQCPLLDSWEAAGVRREGPNRHGVVGCVRELVCPTQTWARQVCALDRGCSPPWAPLPNALPTAFRHQTGG